MRLRAAVAAMSAALGMLVVPSSPAHAAASCEATSAHAYAHADPALQRVSVDISACRRSAPWVILIHGGSWIHGDRASMIPASRIFYRHGWQVFNVEYRRGADVSWPMQQRDMLAAYRWVTGHAAYYGLDLARGSVYGFSAGGQMAAWLGNREPSLTSVVTVSGVLRPQMVADDDTAPQAQTVPTPMHNLHDWEIALLRCDWTAAMNDACRGAWDNFLPETTITPDSPPLFMLQGGLDPFVPQPTPDAYGSLLSAAGVGADVIHDPSLGHTQHLFLDDPHRQWRIIAWMRQQW